MTDVRTETQTLTREDIQPRGDYIWYELMTTDADAAKDFYDAVIGWNIDGQGTPEYGDYRMINRSDGKFAGGVLPLTADMQAHGASNLARLHPRARRRFGSGFDRTRRRQDANDA